MISIRLSFFFPAFPTGYRPGVFLPLSISLFFLIGCCLRDVVFFRGVLGFGDSYISIPFIITFSDWCFSPQVVLFKSVGLRLLFTTSVFQLIRLLPVLNTRIFYLLYMLLHISLIALESGGL